MAGKRNGLRTALSVGVAVVVAAAAIAVAQQPPAAPESNRRVLHEYIPPPDNAAPVAFGGGEGGVLGDTGEGRNPAGFSRGDKIVPKPSRERPPPAENGPPSDEVVHGDDRSFGADRQTSTRPDYQTGPDSTLRYVEVFNPSVVPFKRMTALDAVRSDYELVVAERALRDLPVGGEVASDRDMFWGSLVVEVRSGEDIPIPSVAPDMRILSYEAEPATQFTFAKDSADNYYVRSDETDAAGTYRLVFLADAPSTYFVPRVPSGYRVSDLPAERVALLPDNVRSTANRVLRTLRLRRNQDLRVAVHRLVSYFRAFEAGEPPTNSGDIYWDLFSSQTGVCRHRAFAFVITANALGVPARYVANEAHAWAEVWVPHSVGTGAGHWIRVDLGGAASTLEVNNAADKTMHRPRGEGDLPQPPEYANNYTRLEGDVRGLSSDQIQEAQSPLPAMSSGADGAGASGEPADGAIGDGTGDAAGVTDTPPAAGDLPRTIAPGTDLPEMPSAAYEGKLGTAITVQRTDDEIFRGESFAVEGTLTDDAGVGMAARRIDVFLAPAGEGGAGAIDIGRAVTDAEGRFVARVAVPVVLEVGDYEVFASFAGDDEYRPVLSE